MAFRKIPDVLVVGAGPAGSHAARRLAEAGRSVRLLDENEGARETIVCTGIVGAEAWREMDLPEAAVRDVVPRARFVSPAGRTVEYDPTGPLARVVDRTAFDRALVERADRAGAEVRRGHEVREVRVTGEGVSLTARAPGGPAVHRGRALVVATGHQRWLHEAAGVGTPRSYVHGVHLDVPFTGLDAAELYFGREVAPGFFAWAVPYGGRARLGVLSQQGSGRWFERFVRRPEIRDRVTVPLAETERLREVVHSRGIVQGAVRPSYGDRVLLVGEAAGQVKTTTAGGIYYGMIGAGTAAEVLDAALAEDRLGAGRLAAYEEAWHDRLLGEIEAGLRLQEVGAAMEDEEIDRLFGALQGGLGRAVRRMVRFDWHRRALDVLLGDAAAWRATVGRTVAGLVGPSGR